jgi:hypothetical protein
MGRAAVTKSDGPTSRRLGHGYQDAKDAGVPWDAIRPRKIEDVVKDLMQRSAERADLNEVLALLKNHPNAKERLEELLRLRWTIKDALHKVKEEAKDYRRKIEVMRKAKKTK